MQREREREREREMERVIGGEGERDVEGRKRGVGWKASQRER